MSRSTSRTRETVGVLISDELVAGSLESLADVVLEQGRLGGHGQLAGLQHDVHRAHAGQLADLLGHRRHAVRAGHPLHLPDLCHLVSSQERTSRAMAAEASVSFSSAPSPEVIASLTQWARWSSSRFRATACRAFVIAATWVRMSMQYWSSSTIRCRPRACPSMRRRRLRTSSFEFSYPGCSMRP